MWTGTPGSGQLGLDDGSAPTPSLAFVNDPDCGWYRIGTNIIGLAVAGVEVLRIDANGSFIFGGNPPVTQDLKWDNQSGILKLITRSLILEEAGDAVDLAIRRHEGTFPDGARVALGSGVAIGKIYWQPWDGTDFGVPGSEGPVAEITVQTAGVPSQTSRPGNLKLRTTPTGAVFPVDAFEVNLRQRSFVYPHGTAADPSLHIGVVGEEGVGFFHPGTSLLGIAAGGTEWVRIDGAAPIVQLFTTLGIGANYISGLEMTAPAAPGANGFRLFARDVAGKTQLAVLFNTGAIQQIAIEP